MGEPAENARAERLAILGVLLLALLPSLGTLGAPWIAEDAAILAQVRADGPWADWGRSQYGLAKVLFWRPLVSTSWALQEAWTGIAPLPLRLFNLGLHAASSALVFACARRLGLGRRGAFLAGAWLALFPEQGGTTTWLAGRTDLLCAALLLASVHAALGGAPARSALCAFLACTAKEFGFLAPLWIALLAPAGGGGWRAALRRAGPAFGAVIVAWGWRRVALGTFGGGYPGELAGLGAGFAGTLEAVRRAAWPSLVALALLAVGGMLARDAEPRRLGAALAAAALALVPLYPLLADGWLEPENRRLFYAAECAVALAAGCTWGRGAVRAARTSGLAVLATLTLGARAFLAWNDTHDWARAAREGEQEVARARAAVAGAEAAPRPVLFAGFPTSRFDAYCLGFGLAARFRAPFPVSPRPVWPWRLVFVQQPERERVPLVAPRTDGSIWPMDDARLAAELPVRDEAAQPLARIEVDERVLVSSEDRSPRFELHEGPAGARVEVVLVCELGYEPVPLGFLDESGRLVLSTRALLACTNGVTSAGELLAQAADLGAQSAFAELRALGPGGEVLAASRWIEVVWPPDLLARSMEGGR